MISFVIAALNEEKRIAACVAAIRTNAAGFDCEIVVVDNGSTDETAARAWAAGAQVVCEPVRGISRARKAGLAATSGSLVAFLDADSLLPAGWVACALAHFRSNQVVAVSGPLRFYDAPARINAAARAFYGLARIFHHVWPTVQGGNYIARRRALADAYDPAIEFWGEDTATAVRLAAIGKIVLDPQLVMLTSGRCLLQQGLVATVLLYVLNYLAISLINRPLTLRHKQYR